MKYNFIEKFSIVTNDFQVFFFNTIEITYVQSDIVLKCQAFKTKNHLFNWYEIP